MIQITLNGQTESLPATTSVLGLLENRALAGKRVAVERNGEIVPKGRHADTVLADGDRLEIVVAVGGG
ncbi:sulfur carrier protein ThiS [Cognatazoarcus halotolerans]|uniref:sulfur carrier protein ThiS n=1 Tax=Cognatazoarcus halotolerans TaxID=2686016 RepID=UPI00135BB674|nr:sulfur carrier protein ThiS [Cognatazoarcus halotolerans]MCB1899791.1 sulfur carrier protein ThiS [Rhodocyclaceae bacterium]MCP5307670.1 sulfur carrier protein ThiS [Zoogloeaceae bacterium]